jgi:hypothetical protein
MFQTFAFTAGVLLCGVGYALYKKVIQMLKDIDEKYEGKLKTLVFELEVEHQVSINQLLKDIDAKYELKVNHQESIQKLENTIEYNLEHTETLAIDLNNKFRLLKNKIQEPSPVPVLKIRVNRINIFGKKYFKTTDGIIYDADTMNEVGKQDQITGAYNINLSNPIKTGKLEDINNIIIL